VNRAFSSKLDSGAEAAVELSRCLHIHKSQLAASVCPNVIRSSDLQPIASLPANPTNRDLTLRSLVLLSRIHLLSPDWDTELVCDWTTLSPVMPRWVSLAHDSGDHVLGAQRLLPRVVLDAPLTNVMLIQRTRQLVVRLLGHDVASLKLLTDAIASVLSHCDSEGRALALLVLSPSSANPVLRMPPGLQKSGSVVTNNVSVVVFLNVAAANLPMPPRLPPDLHSPPQPFVNPRWATRWFNRNPGSFVIFDGPSVPLQVELTPCDQASLHWCRGEDIPKAFRFTNPHCPSPNADNRRVKFRPPSQPQRLRSVSGCMGLIPYGLRPFVIWLSTPDKPDYDVPCPAPLSEVEETIQAIRIALAEGSMRLWVDRCSRMADWWRASSSDANLRSLLDFAVISAAANSVRRQRLRDEKIRRVWEAAKTKLTKGADPDSWCCPRSRSLRLRSTPVQTSHVGFSSEETAAEKALWFEGDRPTMKRLHKSLFPWF
jgi:hypothetical protein